MWGRINGLRVLELGTPGPMRAELNALVLSGAKTATAGLMELDYRAEGEDLEQIGEHLVLVDDEGARVAEVEIVSVEVVRFDEVTWEFADAEGEGFVSIEDWRDGHRKYWGAQGRLVSDDTETVCLHIRLVTA